MATEMATANCSKRSASAAGKRRTPADRQIVMVGRGGFEPPKAVPADLQSAPPKLHRTPHNALTWGFAAGMTRCRVPQSAVDGYRSTDPMFWMPPDRRLQ